MFMDNSGTTDKKQAIRDWWASNPMTYGAEHGKATYTAEDGSKVVVEYGSREFFEYADKVFYGWNTAQHNEKGYFGKLFNYDRYKGKPVLEIGCGMGCMAMNWAKHGALLTAVDLNPIAVTQTRRRFEIFGFPADIREADAENLPYEDNTFDYIYSWGVLHHTPRTKQALDEVYRVLRPGGEIGVMLYHRNSILFRYLVQYIEGFFHMENKFLSPLELASRYGDGAAAEGNPHTWPVTGKEVREDLFTRFSNVKTGLLGSDLVNIFNQWGHNFGNKLPKPLLRSCARRWGWSIWITAQKPY